jgi:hypothetical protein
VYYLDGPPSAELARKLAAFEEQFVYALGPGRHFRITHGDDYPRFFRAMGEAVVLVVERDGRVAGTLAVVVRRLVLPDGSSRSVAYFGDLKIAREARGGVILVRLARAVDTWARPKAEAAFSVVMDGTPVTPEMYTGRLGIPAFRALGKILVLRLVCGTGGRPSPSPYPLPLRGGEGRVRGRHADNVATCPASQGMVCFQRLGRGGFFCPDARPTERSETEPTWLVNSDGRACGLLEDTRRGKRLIADDGSELLSAHLSYFAFATPAAGAELLRAALELAQQRGFPALFAGVAQHDAGPLQAALADVPIVVAPATIYGAELEAKGVWNINTAEI